MPTLRRVLVLLATALCFGVSFYMLQRVVDIASPWLGLLLMFFFMGLAKAAQPLFMLRIPETLRAVRPWETSGSAYGRLAVHAFGSFLRNTPLRYLNSDVYASNGRADLRTLCRYIESAEAIHFWAMVLFTPYLVFVWLQGHAAIASVFVLVQLLFHVYPILHLRSVRGRLENLFARSRMMRRNAASDAQHVVQPDALRQPVNSTLGR